MIVCVFDLIHLLAVFIVISKLSKQIESHEMVDMLITILAQHFDMPFTAASTCICL